ncbi:bifunctional diaminohydroxyphosphoribosylaminopyrimidine deaminase/5-amino-6-(5-phosphoribosylamino)uracil reductase RibD [Cellulosilyticum sp. I15G10I2]|uniref:bifunctional diaminohydroxyphosphoribosylaminopyrimidine deaminase/5-amino-6-(5-phosphoribosylamino)uracil reductase RibD n=1 Tax=Cellulosilyticum sp. I15G10I2 TaxID=1892843 RepID=UPI00085C6FA8|nr:bifunctional diaminohydroxyphosphoribosylaminopyrimidine deaminase/5-amino-6-(5-phosphoribosylamino)uracil reductase RibD [Cellulosilyticum sp. I15G10I2]
MDTKYMKRALELARKGAGYTNPNPLVGAVIVKDEKIIGEGYHAVYGGPHAEVNAFRNAAADIKGATMYVTLEPCSHYGKTPPCAYRIVEEGIKKVVVATQDPNPEVSGRGIQILREHGIEVVVGILEEESMRLNEIFFKYITTQRPFCILKTAMTLDGKIATCTGDSKWITNEASREYVHELRHRVSGVMVGAGTVIQDDPFLNTRLQSGNASDPIRIIVDTSAKVPLEANIFHIKSMSGTIIATTELAKEEKIKAIRATGAEVIILPLINQRVDLNELMKKLGERKIDSVLLEGGSELNYSALDAGIVDKVSAFIAPKIIGGSMAKTPVGGGGKLFMKEAIKLNDVKWQHFGEDIMIEGYIKMEG